MIYYNKPVPPDVNRPPIIVEERSLDKDKLVKK